MVEVEEVREDPLLVAVNVLQLPQPGEQRGDLGLHAGRGAGAARHGRAAPAFGLAEGTGGLLEDAAQLVVGRPDHLGEGGLRRRRPARPDPRDQRRQRLVRQGRCLALHRGQPVPPGDGPALGRVQRPRGVLGESSQRAMGRLHHLRKRRLSRDALAHATREGRKYDLAQMQSLALQAAGGGLGVRGPLARLARGGGIVGGRGERGDQNRAGGGAADQDGGSR
ncbi:hypothetical protein NOGI109294_24100 [Nocardiopsis gilva]